MGGDDLQGDEFSIEEMIELELCGIEAVIETVGGPLLFIQIRDRLATLLDHLRQGKVLAEYAEVQLNELRDVREQWVRDNQIPPD